MTEQRRGEIPPIAGSRTLARDVDRRRQIVAGAWIGGFIAVVLLVWVAVVAGGDDGTVPPEDDPMATRDAPDETSLGEEPPGAGPTSDDGDAGDADPDDAAAAGDTAGDDGQEPDGTDEPEPTELTTVTFDGVCTVEIPADEADSDPQPWDHDACVHAPLALTQDEEHWIVVRASLPASEVDAAAAERRADAVGPEAQVLWSSHYPSLNPGLWVVFAGPFPDVDAARDAAEAMGGGAYPRALSLDAAGG